MWTDERVEELKRLWNAGYSASQCAKALGDCSRNAVISKIHRIGLSRSRVTLHRTNTVRTGLQRRGLSKVKPSRRTQVDTNKIKLRDMLARVAAPPASEATDVRKTGLEPLVKHIDHLDDHHCRWIEGQPGTGWCGRNKVLGTSWCIDHAKRVFNVSEVQSAKLRHAVKTTEKEDA